MDLANCPRCGRLFSRQFRTICPNCVQKVEAEYDSCVAYLKENKGATINDVSDSTGVSIRQITQFIREGRISLINAPNLGYPCDSCGVPIREGAVCPNCQAKLKRDLVNLDHKPNRPADSAGGGAYRIGHRDNN